MNLILLKEQVMMLLIMYHCTQPPVTTSVLDSNILYWSTELQYQIHHVLQLWGGGKH
jgi:hypothetical protein